MAILMVVIAGVVYAVLNKWNKVAAEVTHSQKVTIRLKQVLNTITDAETAERGYVITGNDAFLAPYITAKQKVAFINRDSLVAFMPEYKEKINLLGILIKNKMGFVDSMTALVKEGHQQQAIAITSQGRGRAIMDSIRNVISSIHVWEDNRLNAIYEDDAADNKNLFIVLYCNVAGCLILLLIFYLMVLRNAKLRENTETQLLAAKNIAETADRAKTNFLALMSHEIRTPMHDIIATSTLLADTGINEEQQVLANTIYRSSMALLAVVNDIIDFSRIENGKMPLENTPFVLRDCLNEVFNSAGLPTAQNERTYIIDENIPALIECDPARLRQILMSILGEKQAALKNGEISLSVKLTGSSNDTMDIRFTIVDDEVIDPEEKSVIEETNENNSIPGRPNLFGISSLRFSIAARLISLMGGNIKLIDENQQRNIVTFTIKAKKVDEKVSEKILSRLKKSEVIDTTLANRLPLNILVADDHEMNQVLMVQILGKLGYSCVTARNGSEAAGLAIETKFDLIFMDIVMPVMDGIEATKRIREYYVQSNSPVIIGITANALMKESTRGFEAGMNDFLLKPYRPVDIQQAIKKWAPFVLQLDTEQ